MTFPSGWRTSSRALFLLSIALPCLAEAAPKRITLGEGRQLVYETIRVHDPGHLVNVSPADNGQDPDFLHFEATWPNPGGSAHLGNYAVNPWTGAVYDADTCELLGSPSATKLRGAIQKRLRLSKQEYAKQKALRPRTCDEPSHSR